MYVHYIFSAKGPVIKGQIIFIHKGIFPRIPFYK